MADASSLPLASAFAWKSPLRSSAAVSTRRYERSTSGTAAAAGAASAPSAAPEATSATPPPSPGRSQAAGEIYWFQLQSEDAVAAIRFYSGLFGWEIDTGPTGAFLMRRNGTPFASIAQIEDQIPNVSESTWLAAINVADAKKAVAAAKAAGAAIRTDVTEIKGWASSRYCRTRTARL